MDTFKTSAMEESKTKLRSVCFQELQCMYDKLIKPKVTDGTYFVAGGYKQYREDFSALRERFKTRIRGVDSNIVSNLLVT